MNNIEYRNKLLESKGKLRAVAASIVGARSEIDDFLHDTFVYFLKNENRYINHPALEAQLVMKIKNIIKDKNKSKASQVESLDDQNNNISDDNEYMETNINTDNEKEELLIMRMTFDKALKKIKQKCREILNLKRIDKTNEEISGLLEIEIGTVKSRVARCSEELRSIIFDE